MSFFARSIITTADGSHTLSIEDGAEHYHSVNGAVGESMHVFIKNGLLALAENKNEIHILEIGFGTGLNALLSFILATQKGLKINYHALEPYPLAEQEFSMLNFSSNLQLANIQDYFLKMHRLPANQKAEIHKDFTLYKDSDGIHQCILPGPFDLVYFDAFGPQLQPELWTQDIFEKITASMKPQAMLVTYCAKGSVRRAMKAAGLKIEKLPGALGKREMTRGSRVNL
jgi:tRNA U34 5-methylaminomethyl-2-thiouridine-forming methyltransferase MnmC